MEFPQDHYPPQKRILHFAVLLLLSVANVFIVALYAPELLSFQRHDFPLQGQDLWLGAAMNVPITFNMLGFMAGSLIAMLPLSRWDYARRYVKISFLTMILVQMAISAFAIFKMIG